MFKLMDKRNQKGFTLMEMLIVVAIIAILVAIAIPVFTSQLEKAREATDAANIRAAYAEMMMEYLDGGDYKTITKTVQLKQTKAGWQTSEITSTGIAGITFKKAPYDKGVATLTMTTDGVVTCTFSKAATTSN